MQNINYFPENSDIKSKTILLRLDFNVPIKEKIIQDETRIDLCLPFLKLLIKKKSKNYNRKPSGQAKR